jgi:hypothetical protein
MTKNFDRFCARFLFESVSDDEYLRFTKQPKKNKDILEKLVREKAVENKYDSPLLFHGSKNKNFNTFKLGHTKTLDWSISLGNTIHLTSDKSEALDYAQGFKKGIRGFYVSGRFVKIKYGDRNSNFERIFIGDDGKVVLRRLPKWDNIDDSSLIADAEVITKATKEFLSSEGYNGIIDKRNTGNWNGVEHLGSYEYIVFNPSQIKSADTITYDDNGNIIPLSQRFDASKDDIRY